MSEEHLPSPDLGGMAGRAWRYDLAAIRARELKPKSDSSLVSWLIEAKWAHPLWHSYALHLFHLRPLGGMPDAKILLSGATHEMHLFALNPDKPRDITQFPHHLVPADFAAQFIQLDCEHYDDRAAIARVKDAVVEIVNGQLSPDTDYLQSWIARYGDSLIKGDSRRAGETKIAIIGSKGRASSVVIKPQPPTPKHS